LSTLKRGIKLAEKFTFSKSEAKDEMAQFFI
jgi:hypothetical protein